MSKAVLDSKNELSKPIHPKDKGLTNKEVQVSKILGIKVKKFRNMINGSLSLSDTITLISGHNGTMKSTLVGLFVQPFNSDEQDIFSTPLKTQFGDIFKLSSEYDKERYDYNIVLQDENGIDYSIPIYTKPRSKSDPSIRIVTGGNSKSDGNLLFNTNYLNLNRLYSIHTSNAKPVNIALSDKEKEFVTNFYNRVLINNSYSKMETIMEKSLKKTFGPTDGKYDFSSISSGEDNLGRIANSLISFMRIAQNNTTTKFNGLLCIDEIEASLHPVAQINLFKFLYKWSKKYKVQILMNSHSLPLIRYAINQESKGDNIKTYYLSVLYSENIDIIESPSYEAIYKELTFDYDQDDEEVPTINIICEDDLAKRFIRLMVTSQKVNKRLKFISESDGVPYNFLIKLFFKVPTLLKDSIIIFDADVEDNSLKDLPIDKYLKLPDKTLSLPIEKLFVKYILDKPLNDDLFTKKLKMPKNKFIDSLNDFNINIRTIEDYNKIKTKKFKEWFDYNNTIQAKVFNDFSKKVNGREEFVEELISKMNIIFERNGFPKIEK